MRKVSKKTCTIDECGKPHLARGWCSAHYDKWRKYGDPLAEAHKRLPLKWLEGSLEFSGDECLAFPFGRTGMGYGAVYVEGGHQVLAHRWVCEKVHGAPPNEDDHAAHTCGNGHLACINKRHIRWATVLENVGEDRRRHGTIPKGEGHANSKLKNAEVLEIFSRKGAASPSEAGAPFGVTSGAVSAIWSGRTWSWLTSNQA